MFQKLKEYLFRRMIRVGKGEERLDRYYDINLIEENIAIYEGKPSWCNGEEELNVGVSVVSEIARRATIEFESEIDDISGSEYINRQYKSLVDRARETTEKLLAQGNLMLKPYINPNLGIRDEEDPSMISITEDDLMKGVILVDIVNSRNFIPLEFNPLNEMVAVAFIERAKVGNVTYTKLESHIYDESTSEYTVTNKVYEGDVSNRNGMTGKEVRIDIVEDWANIPQETILKGINRPLFVHMKTPYSNNVDIDSPLGVSVFSKIRRQLIDANTVYSDLMHDTSSKRLKIAVPNGYLDDVEGRLGLADKFMDDDMFMKFRTQESSGEGMDIEIFNPELRVQSYNEVLESIYRKIEFNSGLAYGDLSNVNSVEKTAEEIKASKERSWSTVVDLQKQIEKAYREVVEVMYIYLSIYVDSRYYLEIDGLNESLSFHFDDSMVIDEKYELELLMEEYKQGLVSKEYYLTKRYGVTVEKAREMMATEDKSRAFDEVKVEVDVDSDSKEAE